MSTLQQVKDALALQKLPNGVEVEEYFNSFAISIPLAGHDPTRLTSHVAIAGFQIVASAVATRNGKLYLEIGVAK